MGACTTRRSASFTASRVLLAIHPGALGDVLLAVPALRALRAGSPGEPLALGATPRLGRLLAALGVVDAAVGVDSLGLDTLFVDAAARPATMLTTATRLVCWLGSRDLGFVRRLRERVPGAIVAPSVPADGLVWPHLLRTVAAADGDWRRPVCASDAVREAGRRALDELGWDGAGPLVVVHPGAGGRSKRWPAAGFAAVIARTLVLGAHVVVHQGPADADAETATALRPTLDPRVRWLEQPDLVTLAGVLAQATAYIGNDSGVSHLAGAVGCPSLVLFAASLVRWASWSPTSQALVVPMTTASAAAAAHVTDAFAALLQASAAASSHR
jgi:ADP-heptose:LPS heptosyltransferase